MTGREPEFPLLPFGAFGPQFDTLVVAMGNLVDREWPARRYPNQGTRQLVLALLKVSENTYRTIRYIAADEPPEPARKLEYALSIGPLSRTILDALFTVVFLFGKVEERTAWYYRAGWREIWEEHERMAAAYGHEADWQEWLAGFGALVAKSQVEFGVSAAEAAAPTTIPRWPIPSGMIRESHLAADRRDYLQYLNDWFYKTLSQESHMSWPGLARRSGALLPRTKAEEWQLRKQKSDAVFVTIALLLAMVTELELELGFGLKERIQYVWGVLNPYSGVCKELYERHYARFLS